MLLHFSYIQTLLVKYFTNKLSTYLNTEVSIDKVHFSFFNKLEIEGVLINDLNNDTLLYVDEITTHIEAIQPRVKNIELESIVLSGCRINSKYKNQETNFAFIIKAFQPKQPRNPFEWDISCQSFELHNVFFTHNNEDDLSKLNFRLQDIQFEAHKFTFTPDSLYFEISDFKLHQDSSIAINNMSACFSSKGKQILISDLNISTDKSYIKDLSLSIDQSKLTPEQKLSHADIALNLGTTEISMEELAYFFPVIEQPSGSFRFNGEITGRLDSIHGTNIYIQRGKHTTIDCDFYANGLPNFKESEFNLVLRKSSLDFDDLGGLMKSKLVSQNKLLNQILKGVGVIKYDGSFNGTPKNFIAKGYFETNYGLVKGQLSFSPTKNDGTKAQGYLYTNKLHIGKLLSSNQLGTTTFNGRVNALLNSHNKFIQARVEGQIDSLDFNHYYYKNIKLKGVIKPKLFEGEITVNDKNFQLNFNGLANANPKNPNFAFQLNLEHANWKKLNFMDNYKQAEMAVKVNANFRGEDFAHLSGEITLPSGYFTTEYNTLKLDSIRILSTVTPKKYLELKSEFIDYKMGGSYSYSELHKTFRSILHKYMPNYIPSKKEDNTKSNFNFKLQIKNVQPILRTFMPTLAIDTGYIAGHINEAEKKITIDSKINKIRTPFIAINQTELQILTNDEMHLVLNVKDFTLGKSETPFQLRLKSDLAKNILSNQISWESNINTHNLGTLTNKIVFNNDKSILLENYRTIFRLNNVVWQMSPSSITYAHELITVKDFLINNSFQSLYVNGIASEKNDEFLQVRLTNIDLKNLNPFLPKKHQFDGLMNGNIDLYSLFSDVHLTGHFNINDLIYNDQKLGNISLESNWNKSQKAIHANLDIEQPQGKLNANGYFQPGTDSLNLVVHAEKISLNFLSPLLSSLFKNIQGYTSGDLLFHGQKSKLLIDGELMTDKARIALNALNVNYNFSDKVIFRQDSIIFNKIRIYDDENHIGMLNGSLKHTNFNHMIYNLSINSTNLMIMNTTAADNEQFFGKAYGRGNVRISGEGSKVLIDGSATTLANTDISFAPMSDEKAETYNFLSFIDHSTPSSTFDFNHIFSPKPTKQELDMKFNITITPDAKFQLVFNSKIGDVIQAKGKGNMQVNIDQDFNIGMFGKFEVTWGDYLFTLQSIFNKRFSIERGSTIQWSGDPFAADLDIKAIYSLKAPLSDLIVDSYSGYDFTQRVPVNCYIILQDELTNPNISFDIKFPTVEDRIQDELRQYMSTEEDMNRQILSLLLMGSFYTPEYLQGSYTGLGTTFMGTTTSELLSNQLSNWLSAISDDFDFGVNYRPGNSITDDEVELALSTQLFNNRVTLNGNISNNVNTTGTTNTNNNSAFVGDFDILVALNKSGKLQLKAYNHSNNNIIYETSPYKQGVGFSYQEGFNSWSDLWLKIKNIFKKNKNRKIERKDVINQINTENNSSSIKADIE